MSDIEKNPQTTTQSTNEVTKQNLQLKIKDFFSKASLVAKKLNSKKPVKYGILALSSLIGLWLIASGILYAVSGGQVFQQERSYNIEIAGTQKYFIKNKDNQNLEVVVRGSLEKESPVLPMPMLDSVNGDNSQCQNDQTVPNQGGRVNNGRSDLNTQVCLPEIPDQPTNQNSNNSTRNQVIQRQQLARNRNQQTKQTFVIYMHGNSGRIPHFFDQLSEYGIQKNIPLTIVSPSYPGFGLSEGQPNTENVYDTGVKTYDWLISKGISPDQIIVLGHSLGGSPAVYLASQKPQIQKLILVNTFSSIQSMCFRQYSILCTFSGGMLNSAENAKKVEASVKVRQFAYKDDDAVPFSEGEKLFTYFEKSKDKKFTKLDSYTHSYFEMSKVFED